MNKQLNLNYKMILIFSIGIIFLVMIYSFTIKTTYSKTTNQIMDSESMFQTLVFADEFEVDGPVNEEKWLFETMPPNNGSWWNGEKQHYTDRIDNAFVSEGTLKIVAKKETHTVGNSTKKYTSARLNSKFNYTYGKIDIRAKLPSGEGTWPALWTLGSNYETVGWPSCGEIDIMEHWGHEPTIVSSAVHTPACSGVNNCSTVRLGEKKVADYHTAFHDYSMEWTPEAIKFFIDGQLLYSYDPEIKNEENWPFVNSQYIILNVAVGGGWFEIDPEFTESAMEIDYVRVYQ